MRILSFLLAIVFTFTSVPIDAHATGIGSQVTTSIGYSIAQSSSLIGKRESYSIQTGISGTVGSYTLPYSIIYLDKNIFEQPSQSDVSPAEFIQSVSIDSSDAQYYKIKVTYKNLTAGPPKKFPFSATLKNLRNAAGEQFTIKTALFDKNGVELTSDDENFTKSGYVAGIEAPDNGVTNPRMYLFKEYLVDSDVDSTHTKFSPDFQSDVKFTIQNGKKNLTNGEVTNRPTEGVDRRPVRVTITLPSNSVWDPSLPNNVGWTYNSADNTVTKDFTRTLPYFDTTITMKYGTNTNVATQYFPVKTILVNDDSTTDPTTERNGKVYREYEYVKKLKGTKYHLKYNYSVPVDPEYRHKYLITGGQYWGSTAVQNTTTTLNTIIDEPWEKTEFTGYGIRVMDGFFDAANLAKISQNKLIGVNDDGSEEVIQANVPFETVNNATQMKSDTVPISMTPKYYKSIKLVFDDEVTISKYGQDAIGLVLETKLTNAEFTRLKNNMAANPNPSSTNVTNTGKVQSYSNGVWTTISSNAVYIMREEYANMQLDKLSQTINGSTSSSITYTGNTMQYEMTVNYDNSYIFSQDRDVVDGKLIMLVDPELNFESITVGANAFFDLDANPTEVANYAGTGKKAYIFDLNNFAFKKQQQSIFKRDNIKVNFKPDSSLSQGEHKVEAILSWSNNTDRPTSKDPHTVYSKDNTNYLDIYDSNENGSTTDRLSRIEWKFNFVPPQSVIINKLEKLESEPDSAYRAKMKAEKDEIVQYRIMAYNNSGADASALHFIDVFPYVGDKNVVKDYAGNYVDRGSKFATILQGPVTAPAGYTMYYSTDTPKGTLPENLANNWVSESAITDWSQVTMFKAEMNPGVKLSRDDRQYFTYKVKMPDTSNLDENDTSNNSIATWYGNNIDGANENINSKVGIIKYEVSGKAYYDVNDDGKYDTGDVLIANRPVKLIKDGTVIAETTTDANGDYVFKNKITNAGGYTVVAEMLTSDTMIASNPSVGSTIGQDFYSTQSDNSTMFSGQTSTWAKKDITLTKVKHKAVENLGLKNNVSNLKVQHIKEDDNNPLVPEVTTTAGVGTPYTTTPITTDPNYEVDTTQLPTNATGTYATTDTTVVYKYRRKNAGKVVVHHYLVGTTTELYTPAGKTSPSPEELDGTGKLGLPYTTTDKTSDPALSNYELVTPAPTNATGTFQSGEQTVTYYYRRKNAGNITVNHYEVGTTTQLYSPTPGGTPSAQNFNGNEKLGLSENITNKVADIANYEYVNVDVTGATGASTPNTADGATTVTYIAGNQVINYYYRRKNAGNVVVNYLEQGTNAVLATQETLDGTNKLGSAFTTVQKNINDYDFVSVSPAASGTFTTGTQTVNYYYKRKNAGNVVVNYLEQGTNAVLATQETLDGTNKLGSAFTTVQKNINDYDFVSVSPAANGTFTSGTQTVYYYYKRKDVGDVVVKYVEQGTNTPIDTPTTMSGAGKSGLTYTTTPKTIPDYELVVTPANHTGTYPATGTTTVVYEYRRKNAGNITVNHYEVGGSTQLYTPSGSTTPSAQNFDGTNKLGLSENLTNKAADIANYEYVSVDVSGASGATTPAANGDTTVTYKAGNQVVTYRYKRKDAANITVHHVEDGTTTELYTPAGASSPSAVTYPGAGKLGTTESLTNKAADIANYEYVGVDTTGASSATTPSATGDTTLTYGSTPQTVTYKYRRKNAGKVTVHHYLLGTTTELYTPAGKTSPSPEELDGTGKLGLPYTTTDKTSDPALSNYELVTPAPTNATGTFQSGEQTVTYYYRRKNAGNITVNHYEVGTTTQLYKATGASTAGPQTFNGTGKLGLSENITNKEADIANYEYVNVDVAGAAGASTPNTANGATTVTYVAGNQVVNYYYRRKNAANITVHHYEVGTTDELFTPTGASSPSAVVIDGSGRLGQTENLNNEAANIANYEYVSVDVSGASSATTPSATGATTLTNGNSPQTVIYYYRRKNAGNVVVNYLEQGTNAVLATQETLDGTNKLGSAFTTVQKNINDYDFVSVSPAASGTFTTGTQTVNYYYKRKNAGNVVVNYLEQGTNAVLATQETLDGTNKLGSAFTTVQKNINDYDFVSVSPAANGTFTSGTQTVNYYYKRKDVGDVVVKYVEQGTNTPIDTPTTMSGAGKSGLTYTTTPKTIPDYDLVVTPANHTGTYPATGTTTVVYEYKRKNAGDVTVHHYIDGTTTQLVPDVTLSGTGKLGTPYTTTDHNIPNYTLVAQPTNANGTFTTGNQTVTYYYRRNDAGNVVVNYLEQGTNAVVANQENIDGTGQLGLPFTTVQKNINDFDFVSVSPAANGTFASGTQTVNYYYKRKDAANVTVKYVEQGTGTPLSSDDVLGGTGKHGLPYTTSEKNITDYELVAQPSNKNGTFSSTPQTVIYEYRRKPAGDVTSVYVDEDGNQIDIPETQSGTGKLGLPYTTTRKTIPNYTLVSVPSNENGTFVPGPQTVTYVYRRNDAGDVTVYHKSVYDNSDLSTPTVLDGTRKLGLPYTTTPETYSDFEIATVPSNATGTFVSGSQSVTYLYKRKQSGGVTVNYLDNHGNRIETPDNITGTDNVGLPYTTTPKNIPNYTLITVPSNANGTFTVSPITVNYIYKRQDAGNVVIEHVDEDGNVPLDTPEVLDGTERLGDSYTSSSKSFDNYDLVSVPSNANGTFTSGTQTVTYVYRRRDAGNVIAYYVDSYRRRLDTDEIQDGRGKLGLPYTTVAKDILGYHLQSVQGNEKGIFTTGIKEVTYIYIKDSSAIIIPSPLTPVTPSPISPSLINPVTPITPSPITPGNLATPSQIIVPGRYEDVIIRPNRPIATPSIATGSNGRKSGGGSSDGTLGVRLTKTVTVQDTNNTIEKPQIIIDEPNTQDKGNLNRDIKSSISATRRALSVPKTQDNDKTPIYGLMMLISSALAALCIFKKKKS